ncbi:hypothetical protein ACFL3E_02560, partial [Patescibacteria group bacterium]
TTGLFGLFAYLGIFVSALILLFKRWRQNKIHFWTFSIFSTVLLAHLLQNLFVFDAITSFVLLVVIFAFIHSSTRFSVIDKQFKPASIEKVWLLPIAIIISALIFYIGVWKPMQENRFGRLGYDALAEGNNREAVEYIEKSARI